MKRVDELKAAVVGTGFIGVVHVDALRRLGVEVLGVVGSSPERAGSKGLAPVFESYDAMLEDDRVDVVHLTTPNNLHHPQVVQAAALSFAAACHPEEPCEYQSDLAGLLPDVFETAWKLRDGKLELPDMPGLGIAVREETLGKSCAAVESWRAA